VQEPAAEEVVTEVVPPTLTLPSPPSSVIPSSPPHQPPCPPQSQDAEAELYNLDLDHSSKVLSMQEDDTEVQEAVEIVTTAKLMTE
nr:hypothetical protein [Tanacetum cinerariifolium]